MTHASASFVPDGNAAGPFQVWATGVSALLTAAGLAKTADTGQIVTASVGYPAGVNTSAGYEIRTISVSSGTLVAKITYERGAGTNCRLGIIVGTSSDGAGTITGVLTTVKYTMAANATSMVSAIANVSYASTWDGGFALVLSPVAAATYYRQFIIVDCTCNSSGTLTTDGLFVATSQNSVAQPNEAFAAATGYSSSLGVAATFPAWPLQIPVGLAPILPSAVASSKRLISIPRHYTPTPCYHKNFLGVNGADSPSGQVFTASPFGTSLTYLSVGAGWVGLGGAAIQSAATTLGGLAIRWN